MIDMYKEKKPLTVVLIGVMNKDKILLAKRKRAPYAGYYSILGGRQTFGQEIREIVKREVMEETGYKVKDEIHIKGTYSEILKDKHGKVRDHFLFVVCKAFLDEGVKRKKEVEDTDVEKTRWFDFPIKKQDKARIIPTDLIMIENFDSDKAQFKEFILQEDKNKKLTLLKTIDEA